jgi:Spy/CpxP family protein refolding chaperone
MEMSRKFFVCITLSLLTLLWASPSAAQRLKWWNDERYQKELALTPEQSSRIESLFQAANPALRAQQRALSKLEDELDKLIEQAKVAEPEVEHFVTRVEAARAELGRMRTMMIFRMRLVLSAEQNAKLQKLFEQNERERRGKGHGSK